MPSLHLVPSEESIAQCAYTANLSIDSNSCSHDCFSVFTRVPPALMFIINCTTKIQNFFEKLYYFSKIFHFFSEISRTAPQCGHLITFFEGANSSATSTPRAAAMRCSRSSDGDVLPLTTFDRFGCVMPTMFANSVIFTPFVLAISLILNNIIILFVLQI